MEVIYVGLSNKKNRRGMELPPLDESTNSGKLIKLIDQRSGVDSHKINLVPFTPEDEKGKICYPNKREVEENIEECIQYLHQNAPCIAFLLGKLVSKYILDYFKSSEVEANIRKVRGSDIYLASIDHPSFIQVYRRKSQEAYISGIADTIEKYSSNQLT